MKEAALHGERKVYSVSAFNRGVARYLGRLPAVWVEGEVTELRRNPAWATVFLTLADPATGATLKTTIWRTPDRLELALEEGQTVHVAGRPELWEARGELGFRATTIERVGLGDHLLALERLRRMLAAEGLFGARPQTPALASRARWVSSRARTRRLAGTSWPRSASGSRRPRSSSARRASRAGAPRRPSSRRCARSPRIPRSTSSCSPVEEGAGGPAPVQRRGGRSGGRVLPRPRRLGGGPRAGRAAFRDLAADVRVRADSDHRGGLPRRPRRTRARGRAGDLQAPDFELGVRALVARDTAVLARSCERLRSAPRLLLERRRAALDHASARLQALLAPRDAGPRLRDRPPERVRRARRRLVSLGDRFEIELGAGELGAVVDEVRP